MDAELNALVEETNKKLLEITNRGWKNYARPAMLDSNEKRERGNAVRFAHRATKNEFIKRLRAAKLEGIV